MTIRTPRAELEIDSSQFEVHRIEIERREVEVSARERALAMRANLAESMLAAACERNATSDALDALAEERERARDLASLLAPASDEGFGADWPARRLAALHREHARADRASAHADLSILVSDFRNSKGGELDIG
jgi:hypothetical protein